MSRNSGSTPSSKRDTDSKNTTPLLMSAGSMPSSSAHADEAHESHGNADGHADRKQHQQAR